MIQGTTRTGLKPVTARGLRELCIRKVTVRVTSHEAQSFAPPLPNLVLLTRSIQIRTGWAPGACQLHGMCPLACILVSDAHAAPSPDVAPPPTGHPYTQDLLKATLQCLGCKPRHAYQLSDLVFESVHKRVCGASDQQARHPWRVQSASGAARDADGGAYCVAMSRVDFNRIVMEGLTKWTYGRGAWAEEWQIACRSVSGF